MKGLQVFKHAVFGELRIVDREGNPWFIASDVCKCLELSNVGQAVAFLDEDEKASYEGDLTNITNNDVYLRGRNPLIVSEAGLYSLILKSRKPEAKAVKRWITHEVLPAIRKHGAYLSPDVLAQTIADPSYIIGVVTALKQEQDARKLAEQKIAIDAPMTQLGECITGSGDLINVDEFVKIARNKIRYYKGQNQMFEWLRRNGYVRKDRGYNIPTALSDKMGVLKLTLEPRQQGIRTVFDKVTKVTPKGISYFLRKLLDDDDVSPYQAQSNLF
jgi:prophage antirepressor-like protein